MLLDFITKTPVFYADYFFMYVAKTHLLYVIFRTQKKTQFYIYANEMMMRHFQLTILGQSSIHSSFF